jgi:hypothetical protein
MWTTATDLAQDVFLKALQNLELRSRRKGLPGVMTSFSPRTVQKDVVASVAARLKQPHRRTGPAPPSSAIDLARASRIEYEHVASPQSPTLLGSAINSAG